MHLEYQAKGVDMTATLETWLQKRLRKFTRYDEQVRVELILRRNHAKGPVEVDLILHTQWGRIQSKNQGYNARTALSKAIAKIEEQLRRFKEKRTVARRRRTAEALQTYAQRAMIAEGLETPVVRVDLEAVPLMTVEEAVHHLANRQASFLIFRDMENKDRLSVVYWENERRVGLVQASE